MSQSSVRMRSGVARGASNWLTCACTIADQRRYRWSAGYDRPLLISRMVRVRVSTAGLEVVMHLPVVFGLYGLYSEQAARHEHGVATTAGMKMIRGSRAALVMKRRVSLVLIRLLRHSMPDARSCPVWV